MKQNLLNSLRALLLSVAVLLSMPMLAEETTVTISGIYYQLNAETKLATVIKQSSGYYSGSIQIPESVEHEGVTYSVTSIGDGAFKDCSRLTSVTIPNSVTSIEAGAFAECTGLTSVTIPNSVTSIKNSAFYDCSGLTSVTIGNGVTSIGNDAFKNCQALREINIEEGNETYDSREGCNAIIETASNTLISGCKTSIIPNSVTSIGDGAFEGCTGLTSVTIPNSVTSIKNRAFYGCSGLTSIAIGSGVKSIGSEGMAGCSSLAKVYCYAENPPSNNYNSFDGTPINDASLYVPAGSIDAYENDDWWRLFHTISALPQAEIDGVNYQLYPGFNVADVIALGGEEKYSGEVVIPESVVVDDVTYSVESIGQDAFKDCSGLTSVTISNSVESIGYSAFSGCSGLTSVTIGNSVESIKNHAFNGCTGLTSVTIPNSVTSIGANAFLNCSGLTSVSIPNSVVSIDNYAFTNCSALPSVTIPNSVVSIGKDVFSGCSSLVSITVEEGNSKYDSRDNCNAIIETASNTLCFGFKSTVIPNSVTSIGEYAFHNCTGLSSVTIPNSVTNIGYYAFGGCTGLTSVTIPNSVTSIDTYAFGFCDGLTSVSIPNSVTSMGIYIFYRCYALKDVYCYAETVPEIDETTFKDCPLDKATLHVPAGSVESYRSTSHWSDFGTISSFLDLVDGEEFKNDSKQELEALTYTRTLPNMLWNPLYVPFKIPYEALEENYEVAYINAMHSYDNDDDGEIDEMAMEIVKIKAGTLKPNHPYLIKAKNEEAKEMSIVQKNATLYPTQITTLDCSSVYTKFEIKGTYQEMTSEDLNGSLVITTDGAWQNLSSSSTLKPFRFYLTISSRDGSPVEIAEEAMSRVRISVRGEDDNATGIDEVKTENAIVKTAVYDLSGRRVNAPAKGGVYIINGKKVVY